MRAFLLCASLGVCIVTSARASLLRNSAPKSTVAAHPRALPPSLALCAAGWTHYDNADKSEPSASCFIEVTYDNPGLQLESVNGVSWHEADRFCTNMHLGATLLTVNSNNGYASATGLFATVLNVATGVGYIGCSQPEFGIATGPSLAGRSWAWINNRAKSDNLRCLNAGIDRCQSNLWQPSEPRCGACPSSPAC